MKDSDIKNVTARLRRAMTLGRKPDLYSIMKSNFTTVKRSDFDFMLRTFKAKGTFIPEEIQEMEETWPKQVPTQVVSRVTLRKKKSVFDPTVQPKKLQVINVKSTASIESLYEKYGDVKMVSDELGLTEKTVSDYVINHGLAILTNEKEDDVIFPNGKVIKVTKSGQTHLRKIKKEKSKLDMLFDELDELID